MVLRDWEIILVGIMSANFFDFLVANVRAT